MLDVDSLVEFRPLPEGSLTCSTNGNGNVLAVTFDGINIHSIAKLDPVSASTESTDVAG